MLYWFLFAKALIYNIPTILFAVLARNRMPTWISRGLVALGFAASTGYWLWRVEWFDLWRHGLPSPSYLLKYALCVGIYGVAGWCFASRLPAMRGIFQRIVGSAGSTGTGPFSA
jgi:hypothetical protein